MKNITLTCAIFFSSVCINAQTKLEQGKTLKVADREYQITLTHGYVGAINLSSRFGDRPPPAVGYHLLLPIEPKDIKIDMPEISASVSEVLRAKESSLRGKEIMTFKGVFDDTGKLIEILFFTFKSPTIVTIEEVDAIYNKLVGRGLIRFSGQEYRKFPTTVHTVRVRF